MARPDEYAHYVVGLLTRFTELASLYPGVATNFAMGYVDLTWLPPAPMLGERTVHPIEALERWLDPLDDLDDERALIALAVALAELDSYFAPLPARYEVIDDGVLAVGRRTWVPAARAEVAGPNATRAGAASSVGAVVGARASSQVIAGQWPFPHLRWIALRDSELYPFESAPAGVLASARESGKLVVGTCSLPGNRTRFASTKQISSQQYGLCASSVEAADGGAVDREVLACLDWARARGVQVLAFPEVSVGPAQLSALRREIARDPGALQVIVPGTFYVPAEGHRRYLHPHAPGHFNRAPLWVVAGGDLVEWSHYDKSVPFTLQADPEALAGEPDFRAIAETAREHGCEVAVEDIRSSGTIRLLPTEIGVFGFAIGRDVLDLCGLGNPLQRYADFVDFLVVVSYNGGHTSLFDAAGEAPARWHDCATFYVNAAQAVIPDASAAPDAPPDTTVELAFGTWPVPGVAAGADGQVYYHAAPVVSAGRTGSHHALPADGNVAFDVQLPGEGEAAGARAAVSEARAPLQPARGIVWLP